MNKKLVGVVAVVIIATGAYLAFGREKDDTVDTKTTQDTQQTQKPAQENTAQPTVAAVITYTDTGFSPSTKTVKSGDTVEIKNMATSSVQFDSDPHPAHTDNVELNVGIVSPGESKTFKVTTTGTFGFHNHIKASDKATITVE
jgi:plastocyanin